MHVKIVNSQLSLSVVRRIAKYFDNVTVDEQSPAQYLKAYESAYQACFEQYGLKTEPLWHSTEATPNVCLGGNEPVHHVFSCGFEHIDQLTVK